MIRFFSFAVIGLFISSFALAQETVPLPKGEKTNQDVHKDMSGAVKVEKKPAVVLPPAEKSEKAETKTEHRTEHHEVTRAEAKPEHLFGVHASLGIPHPINVGINYVHPSKYVSAEASIGSYSVTVSGVDATIKNTELALRYHPFAGSFFLGVLGGQQQVDGSESATVSGFGSVKATATIKSTYITPHLGWMWGLQSSGFFANFELGYQSNSGVTSTVNSDADATTQAQTQYQTLAQQTKDDAEKYGKMALPYVCLLKVGWLF